MLTMIIRRSVAVKALARQITTCVFFSFSHFQSKFTIYSSNLQFTICNVQTMIMRGRCVAVKASRQQMAKARSSCKWAIATIATSVYSLFFSFFALFASCKFAFMICFLNQLLQFAYLLLKLTFQYSWHTKVLKTLCLTCIWKRMQQQCFLLL